MARLNSSNVLVPWVLMDEQPLLDETTSPKSEKTSWLKERNSSNMWPKLIMRIKVICHKCTKSYVTHLIYLAHEYEKSELLNHNYYNFWNGRTNQGPSRFYKYCRNHNNEVLRWGYENNTIPMVQDLTSD